ncbi:MAG: SBBP repeat-containing protein, partial [Magnetococcus sp. YQC-3]
MSTTFGATSSNIVVISDSNGNNGLTSTQMTGFSETKAGNLSVYGSEFQINSYMAGTQNAPDVSLMKDGGFIVTWTSTGQDGSGDGVYGQRFDASGKKVGDEILLNTTTAGLQQDVAVTGLANGGFLATWQSESSPGSYSFDVMGQFFDVTGNKSGNQFKINTYGSSQQWDSRVIQLAGGDIVVGWISYFQDGSMHGLYGQRYDSNGTPLGGEFRVNTCVADEQRNPELLALSNGGFLFSWNSKGQDGSGWGIYGQLFDAQGTAIGTEFRVNTTTTGNQSNPNTTQLTNGNIIVTWNNYALDGTAEQVVGQIIDATGNKIGSEIFMSDAANNGGSPKVAALQNGGFAVMWSAEYTDSIGYDVYTQAFDSTGSNIGSATRINNYADSYQIVDGTSKQLVMLPDGNLISVWVSDGQDGSSTGIIGRFLSSSTLLVALDDTQLNMLTSTGLSSMAETILNDMNSSQLTGLADTQLNGLTSTQLAALAVTQLNGLTSTQLAALAVTQLNGLSSTQLASLSVTQLNGLSSMQLASLAVTQLNSLSSAQLAGMTHTPSNANTTFSPMLLPGTSSGYSNSITVDKNGGLYFSGSSVVQKMDDSGNVIWTKDADSGGSIAVDKSGNVYTSSSSGGVRKLNALGNPIWATGSGGGAVAVDTSGNLYVTGRFQGSMDIDPGLGTTTMTSAGSDDIFVQKLDSAGNLAWAKQIGAAGLDYGNSLAVDGNGNVYVTGSFSGTVDFDPGEGVSNLTSAGGWDIFIQKLDASGNLMWAKRAGAQSGDQGYSLKVDDTGNVYLTGYFQNTVDFDPGEGVTNLTSEGSTDIFIQKLDSSGNLLWVKQSGGPGNDQGLSLAVDGSGNVYTTGYFINFADFDPGPGTSYLDCAGNLDIFIQKLDASGNLVWAKRAGGAGWDYGRSLAVDGGGNVYVTGTFAGTVDFDMGEGIANLTSVAGSNVFLLKLDADGNLAKNVPQDILSSAVLMTLANTQLDRLTSTDLSGLADTQLNGLMSAQLIGLADTQLDGLVSSQIVGLAETQLDGLTSTQLTALANTQLDGITSTQLTALANTQMDGITSTQLTALANTQLDGITSTQLTALANTQL